MSSQAYNADRVRALELAAAMNNGRIFSSVYFAMALCVMALIDRQVSLAAELIWAGLYTVYITLRVMGISAYLRDPRRMAADRVEFWRNCVIVSAIAHGCILGSLALFALPGVQQPSQFILTAAVIMICAGGSVYVSSVFEGLILLLTAAILPFSMAWLWIGSPLDKLMAGMTFFAWALNIFLGWHHHRVLSNGWRLVSANEALAAELGRQNEVLEHIGSSRTRLFAIASHDLRQPVHALGLTVAQLNEYDPPQTLRRYFDQLQESSFLVSEMLQELMDLSNLERNDYSLRVMPVDLDAILEQVRMAEEVFAKRKGLTLRVPRATRLVVLSDVNLLRRILLNLLSNAVKYTAFGSVSIECAVEQTQVFIKVTDTGSGIPEQRIDEIFEDYVRLEGTRTSAQGIGLGLAIVKRAAELLGHTLRVTSVVGKGSMFELSVPLHTADITQSLALPSASLRDGAIEAKGKLIVLIEDDVYALQSLKGLLEKWGFTTIGAASAHETLTLLSKHAIPSLIIADLQLSARDTGFDAIQMLRQFFNAPNLPAILLTGDVRPAVTRRAEELNLFVAHKPFSATRLRHEIERALTRHDNLLPSSEWNTPAS